MTTEATKRGGLFNDIPLKKLSVRYTEEQKYPFELKRKREREGESKAKWIKTNMNDRLKAKEEEEEENEEDEEEENALHFELFRSMCGKPVVFVSENSKFYLPPHMYDDKNLGVPRTRGCTIPANDKDYFDASGHPKKAFPETEVLQIRMNDMKMYGNTEMLTTLQVIFVGSSLSAMYENSRSKGILGVQLKFRDIKRANTRMHLANEKVGQSFYAENTDLIELKMYEHEETGKLFGGLNDNPFDKGVFFNDAMKTFVDIWANTHIYECMQAATESCMDINTVMLRRTFKETFAGSTVNLRQLFHQYVRFSRQYDTMRPLDSTGIEGIMTKMAECFTSSCNCVPYDTKLCAWLPTPAIKCLKGVREKRENAYRLKFICEEDLKNAQNTEQMLCLCEPSFCTSKVTYRRERLHYFTVGEDEIQVVELKPIVLDYESSDLEAEQPFMFRRKRREFRIVRSVRELYDDDDVLYRHSSSTPSPLPMMTSNGRVNGRKMGLSSPEYKKVHETLQRWCTDSNRLKDLLTPPKSALDQMTTEYVARLANEIVSEVSWHDLYKYSTKEAGQEKQPPHASAISGTMYGPSTRDDDERTRCVSSQRKAAPVDPSLRGRYYYWSHLVTPRFFVKNQTLFCDFLPVLADLQVNPCFPIKEAVGHNVVQNMCLNEKNLAKKIAVLDGYISECTAHNIDTIISVEFETYVERFLGNKIKTDVSAAVTSIRKKFHLHPDDVHSKTISKLLTPITICAMLTSSGELPEGCKTFVRTLKEVTNIVRSIMEEVAGGGYINDSVLADYYFFSRPEFKTIHSLFGNCNYNPPLEYYIFVYVILPVINGDILLFKRNENPALPADFDKCSVSLTRSGNDDLNKFKRVNVMADDDGVLVEAIDVFSSVSVMFGKFDQAYALLNGEGVCAERVAHLVAPVLSNRLGPMYHPTRHIYTDAAASRLKALTRGSKGEACANVVAGWRTINSSRSFNCPCEYPYSYDYMKLEMKTEKRMLSYMFRQGDVMDVCSNTAVAVKKNSGAGKGEISWATFIGGYARDSVIVSVQTPQEAIVDYWNGDYIPIPLDTSSYPIAEHEFLQTEGRAPPVFTGTESSVEKRDPLEEDHCVWGTILSHTLSAFVKKLIDESCPFFKGVKSEAYTTFVLNRKPGVKRYVVEEPYSVKIKYKNAPSQVQAMDVLH